MPVPTVLDRTGYAGAIDVLANFWFKHIEFSNANEKALPEMSLEMSAEAALACCLEPHGLTNKQSCIEGMFEDGFSMGIRVAAILAQQPLDAEASLRRLVDELVAVIQKRRQDESAPRAFPKRIEES
jgi:hypothetical protein